MEFSSYFEPKSPALSNPALSNLAGPAYDAFSHATERLIPSARST